MDIDQGQLIFGFCVMMVSMLSLAYMGQQIARRLSKPRGTYGNGLPERRRRKRIMLPDPAMLRPRALDPGTSL